MSYIYNLADTWNAGGTTFTAIKMTVTDTASASGSLLIDLQVGTSSKFKVNKSGVLNINDTTLTSTGAEDLFFSSASAYQRVRAYSFWSSAYNGGIGNSGVASGGNSPVHLSSLSTVGWTSGALINTGTYDLFIGRAAAANLRLGDANAAAPVAQTLSVQSVVAGTSNTAGTNLTITGSQGTGTGIGGDIIFQVAPAGGSGTAQNTLVQALRVYNDKTVAVGAAYTVATLPAAGTQGRRAWVTDATLPTFLGTLTGGGAVVCPVFDNGTAWVSA